MRRGANITGAIAATLWGGLFLVGRGGTYGIYRHGVGVFPVAGQIDFYIVIPLLMMIAVGGCAWLVNALQRWFTILGVVSLLALFALLPYLMGFGGGV